MKSPPAYLMAVLGLFLAAAPAAFSAPNPEVIKGVATYHANIQIGPKNAEGKPTGGAFIVPSDWNKIIIKANVTVTGRFYTNTRDTDLTIEGESSDTSILKGYPRSVVGIGDSKAGIYKSGKGKLFVKKLKILDQPGRGIIGWSVKDSKGVLKGQINVTSCNIIQTPDDYTTDGVHASGDGNLTYSTINVYDDSTYATMCNWIQSVVFIHRRSGAPIQIGWGENTGGDLEKTIKDCTFTASYTSTPSQAYLCGTIDWKSTSVKNDSIKLKMSGITRNKANTSNTHPPKFAFGEWNSAERTDGAVIKVKGWDWKSGEVRLSPDWTDPNDPKIKNKASTGKVTTY